MYLIFISYKAYKQEMLDQHLKIMFCCNRQKKNNNNNLVILLLLCSSEMLHSFLVLVHFVACYHMSRGTAFPTKLHSSVDSNQPVHPRKSD